MSEAPSDPPLTPEQRARVGEAKGLVDERVGWHVRRTGFTWLAAEMKSAGEQAVVESARRYSPKWRTTFRTFATYRVNGAILDFLRAEARQRGLRAAAGAAARWGVHVPETTGDDALDPMSDDEAAAGVKLRRALEGRMLSAAMALAAEVQARAAAQPDPEQIAECRPATEALRRVRGALTEREQTILSCVYDRGLDLHDTAVEVGLAYPTVKVLHAKLLHRMRDVMTSRGVHSPFSR
jgi:RNA polymerase sigma factor (sigma-70 family)